MARWFAATKCRPDLVLCSAASRARETFALVREAIGDPNAAIEKGLYLASAGRLLARLRRVADDVGSVIIIGHNPGLHDLAVALTPATSEAQARIAEKLRTAAVVQLAAKINRWRDLDPKAIRLVAYTTPGDLED
jgi:phosphohistidine phosphatase